MGFGNDSILSLGYGNVSGSVSRTIRSTTRLRQKVPVLAGQKDYFVWLGSARRLYSALVHPRHSTLSVLNKNFSTDRSKVTQHFLPLCERQVEEAGVWTRENHWKSRWTLVWSTLNSKANERVSGK